MAPAPTDSGGPSCTCQLEWLAGRALPHLTQPRGAQVYPEAAMADSGPKGSLSQEIRAAGKRPTTMLPYLLSVLNPYHGGTLPTPGPGLLSARYNKAQGGAGGLSKA